MARFTLLIVLFVFFSETLLAQFLFIDPPGPFDINTNFQNFPTLEAQPAGALVYTWYLKETLSPCTPNNFQIGTGQTWVPSWGVYYCVATWPNGTTSTSQEVIVRDIATVPSSTPNYQGYYYGCGSKTIYMPPTTNSNCFFSWWDSYQWKKNGVNIPGANASSYTATLSGYYKCTVSSTVGVATSDSVFIRIDAPITAAISAAGPTAFCNGGSVVLNETAGPGQNHQWQKNNINIANAFGTSYTVTQAGNYRCIVTNGCGTYTSNTISITVTNGPAATISANSATTICTGTVPLSTTAGATGTTYKWNKNGIVISGATGTTYNAPGTGSYTVTHTLNGCTGTSSAIAVTVHNTVPAKPGTISHTNGILVCPGNVRTYTIAAVSNATSYLWTAPSGGTITSGQGTTSAAITYNSGFTATDTLRVQAVNICGNSLIRTLAIKRNNPVIPSIITGLKYGVCNLTGTPYMVTNVSGMTYTWTFNSAGASVASGQGTSSITANYNSSFITGTLQVVATNGCGTSAARAATIYSRPATAAAINGATSVCALQQNVSYSIAPLFSATSYTWTGPTGSHISDGVTTSSGNILTTTATSVTVNYGSTAGYLRVKGNNTCAAGANKSVSITMPCRIAGSINADDNIVVYPNPSYGEFILEYNGGSLYENDLVITNLTGQVVEAYVTIESQHRCTIAGLPEGVFFISLNNPFKMIKVVSMGK